mmetsp:Transcript_51494/g.95256  ORF Transcript_51494/g.95256 Transcript_51494/m.95256 type:complete len:180 (-) Transcript_51494:93-632(-)
MLCRAGILPEHHCSGDSCEDVAVPVPSSWEDADAMLQELDEEIRSLQSALRLKTAQRSILAKREQALRKQRNEPNVEEIDNRRPSMAHEYTISTSFCTLEADALNGSPSFEGEQDESHGTEVDLADMLEVVGLARCGWCGQKMPIDDRQAITEHSLQCEAEFRKQKLRSGGSAGGAPGA